jgi:hypothetical protein
MGCELSAVILAGILATTVAVMDEARGRLAIDDSHLQCL